MAYTITTAALGLQAIATTDTVQNHALGTRVRAVDPTYGEGEFIYLKGVASTVVGSVVTFDQYGGSTTLAPSTANLGQPVAVAMSANVASQFGWYQIAGAAVAATNGTLTTGSPVFLAGSGQLTSTAAAGKQVLGARSVAATGTPSAGLAVVQINEPSCQGQIT
jgi:hypothetical protein